MQQVEREVRDGPSRAAGDPPLQLGRVRAPARIDDHQLPVEYGRPRIDANREPGELGECRADVAPRLVDEPNRAAARRLRRADVGERAEPAPRRLEQML